ncbi:MAG: mannosyltransferase [Blastocatellia bacterium]|jgi:uncharacterized membrane protein|nr:mannosyltransferase [Blastocatellia bacterium]
MNASREVERTTPETNARPDVLSRRANILLFGLVVTLFVAVRLRGLTAACLWFDEIFSVHAARHNWSQILSFAAADLIHPPLFYVLLKVWIAAGGESVTWLRLFPALTSIAAIVPFCLVCRELRLNAGERNLSLLLLAISGFLIKYAQEVRMYSLLFFFSLCSLWLFLKFLNGGALSKRILMALTASNLVLVYTHYSGWVAVAVQCLAILLWQRHRWRSFLASAATLVVIYIPWLYELKTAAEPGKGLAQNIGWVRRPGLPDIAQAITTLGRPFVFSQSSTDSLYDPLNTTLVILLLVVPLFVLGWYSFMADSAGEPREVEIRRVLFLLAFAPALFIFAFSWILPQSIWGTRHLIISAGPYCILAAIALKRLRPYWIRVTVFLLLACWALLAGTFQLLSPVPGFIWCAWEPMAHQLMQVDPGSTKPLQVYAFEDLVAYHLWYGLDASRNPGTRVAVIKGVAGVTEDTAYFLPRKFGEIAVLEASAPLGDDFWIAFRARAGEQTPGALDFFTRRGYHADPLLKTTINGQEAFLVRMHRE